MYAGAHDWPIVGATIFQAYGTGQSPHALVPAAIRAAQAADDLPMTSGQQQRDWIYVADVADALTRMVVSALPPGSSCDIGTGKATPVQDVAALIYRLVGRGGQPRPGLLPDRPNEPDRLLADIESTSALLGWRAGYPLRDGLARLVQESEPT
jgi:dolichol-phosphate mannosyltransferase